MAKKILIFLFCFLFLFGCEKRFLAKDKEFIVAGTYLIVRSNNPQAAGIVYRECQRLEKIFNPYDKNSELYQLNHSLNKEVKVSEDLFQLIKLAKDVFTLTQGYFDPSQGKVYRLWKEYLQGNKDILPKIKENLVNQGMDAVKLNEEKKTVILLNPKLELDLSGIAKGYMVDRAVIALKEAGIKNALINLGGEIYALGRNNQKPWQIGIRNPLSKDPKAIIEVVSLENEAIASSGYYEQYRQEKGHLYTHIVNPKTGQSIDNNILAVSVISSNCTTADALATAFMVMGKQGVMNFLEKNPSTMKIYLFVQEKQGNLQIYIF